MTAKKPKICIITTVASSLYCLFPDFYSLLIDKGYEVVAISADSEEGNYLNKVQQQGARTIVVPMTRFFTVLNDLRCLIRLYKIFKREKFDLIHYSTPKAAFLASIAGKMEGSACLLYTLRGLGYTAFSGLKRKIGKFCEKIACRNADFVIAISKSLKEQASEENLLPAERIEVLSEGSSKGVDLELFCSNEQTKTKAGEIKQQMGIDDKSIIIGFAGRLSAEKGIDELVAAFLNLHRVYSQLHLVIVGPQDERNPVDAKLFDAMRKNKYIHLTGRVPVQDMPVYLAAMDIFVLPSYREGFGNVVIEASAMELPVIASDIPGCRDTLIDCETGYLVPPHDSQMLQQALERLISVPADRDTMGKKGRKFVAEKFDRKIVWSNIINIYEELFKKIESDDRFSRLA